MVRKLSFAASRHGPAAKVFRWLMLVLIGMVGGILLGELAVGNRALGISDEIASYSRFSANPDALVPQGEGAAPCPSCADSYGVAVRMRTHRDDRMSEGFRELGAIDVDPMLTPDPADDYRFGGRFPDPELDIEPHTRGAEAGAKDLADSPPAGDTRPADEAPGTAEEY